jgi:hypothetical protein
MVLRATKPWGACVPISRTGAQGHPLGNVDPSDTGWFARERVSDVAGILSAPARERA